MTTLSPGALHTRRQIELVRATRLENEVIKMIADCKFIEHPSTATQVVEALRKAASTLQHIRVELTLLTSRGS